MRASIPLWCASLTKPFIALNKLLGNGLEEFKHHFFNCSSKLASVIHHYSFIIQVIIQSTYLFMWMTLSSQVAPIPFCKLSSLSSIRYYLEHLGGLNYFLGIEVKHDLSNSLFMSQSIYIRELLQMTNMLKFELYCYSHAVYM